MSKSFVFGQDARNKISTGVSQVAKPIGLSMGPQGKLSVFRKRNNELSLTKDGVSISRASLPLKDLFENYGAELLVKTCEAQLSETGDGTSLAAVLTSSLVNEGVKFIAAGQNFANIKKGIEFAVKKIMSELKIMSFPVKSKDQIINVGSISSNGDIGVGQLIADAMEKVGNNGIINLEEGKGFKTELSVTNGYNFDRGYLSTHFTTNEKGECDLKDPIILIAEKEIADVNIMLPVMKKCHESFSGRPLLIIAENVTAEALATLMVNHLKQSFKSCCVKCPGFGDRRKEMLQDLCVLTGAQLVSEELGKKLENFDVSWLGTAKKVLVTKGSCTIVEGSGKVQDMERRVAEIRNGIASCNDDWDKQKQEERLAKLVGGVAVISVGGNTEQEIGEKKDRVEDALAAIKAAISEGIVAGGGVAILKAATILDRIDIPEDLRVGAKIVRKAAEEPLKRIVENAGGDPMMVRLRILENPSNTFGFNARTEKFEDLVEGGVIDPVKVVRCALQNAASVAALILTTECMIVDEPDEKEKK